MKYWNFIDFIIEFLSMKSIIYDDLTFFHMENPVENDTCTQNCRVQVYTLFDHINDTHIYVYYVYIIYIQLYTYIMCIYTRELKFVYFANGATVCIYL